MSRSRFVTKAIFLCSVLFLICNGFLSKPSSLLFHNGAPARHSVRVSSQKQEDKKGGGVIDFLSRKVQDVTGRHKDELSAGEAAKQSVEQLVEDLRGWKTSEEGIISLDSSFIEELDRGLERVSAAVQEVIAELSAESGQSDFLRAALTQLQEEKKIYIDERERELERIETITQEYEAMRRQLSQMEGEQRNTVRKGKMVEKEREDTRNALEKRVAELKAGFDEERRKFDLELARLRTSSSNKLKPEAPPNSKPASATQSELTRAFREGTRVGGNEVSVAAAGRLEEVSDAFKTKVKELTTQLQAAKQETAALKSEGTTLLSRERETRKALQKRAADMEAQLRARVEENEKDRNKLLQTLNTLETSLSDLDKEAQAAAKAVGLGDLGLAAETRRARRQILSDAGREISGGQRQLQETVTKQTAKYMAAYNALEAEATQLRARANQIEAAEASLLKSKQREAELKKSVSSLGQQLSSMHAQLTAVTEALSTEKEGRMKAEAKAASAEGRLSQDTARLRETLNSLQKNFDSQKAVYEGTIRQLQGDLESAKAGAKSKGASNQSIEAAEAEVAALKQQLKNQESKYELAGVPQLQSSQSKLQNQVIALETRLKTSAAEVEAQKEKAATLQGQVERLQERASLLEAQAVQVEKDKEIAIAKQQALLQQQAAEKAAGKTKAEKLERDKAELLEKENDARAAVERQRKLDADRVEKATIETKMMKTDKHWNDGVKDTHPPVGQQKSSSINILDVLARDGDKKTKPKEETSYFSSVMPTAAAVKRKVDEVATEGAVKEIIAPKTEKQKVVVSSDGGSVVIHPVSKVPESSPKVEKVPVVTSQSKPAKWWHLGFLRRKREPKTSSKEVIDAVGHGAGNTVKEERGVTNPYADVVVLDEYSGLGG